MSGINTTLVKLTSAKNLKNLKNFKKLIINLKKNFQLDLKLNIQLDLQPMQCGRALDLELIYFCDVIFGMPSMFVY